jgi:hypothetical protein
MTYFAYQRHFPNGFDKCLQAIHQLRAHFSRGDYLNKGHFRNRIEEVEARKMGLD